MKFDRTKTKKEIANMAMHLKGSLSLTEKIKVFFFQGHKKPKTAFKN